MFTDLIETFFLNCFDFFKNKDNAYYISEYMFILGALILLYITILFVTNITALIKIQKSLKKNIGKEKCRNNFYNNFDNINIGFKKSSLSHAWNEFCETMLDNSEAKVKQNTHRPEYYINTSCIKSHPKIFSSFPNIFVGFGLICTFFGLSASLYGVSINGDIENIQDGLQNIISAASIKFISSISGLIISIMLSVTIRLFSWLIQNQFSSINNLIEEGTQFLSTEDLLNKQLTELNEQTTQISNFNGDLAANLGEEIENRLSSLFKEGIRSTVSDGMNNEIESVVNTLKSVNDSFLQVLDKVNNSGDIFGNQISSMSNKINEMMEQTNSKIDNNINDLMTNVKTIIKQISAEFHSNFSNVTKDFNEGIHATNKSLLDTLNNSGNNFSQILDESATKIQDSINNLGIQTSNFSNSINLFDNNITKHLDNIQNSTQSLNNVIKGLSGNIQEMKLAGEPFKSAGQLMQEYSNSLMSASQNLDKFKEELTNNISILKNSNEITVNSWKSYQERFEGVDNNLKNTFELIDEHIANNQNNIMEFVKSVDMNFTKALSSLNSAIENLSELLQEKNEN